MGERGGGKMKEKEGTGQRGGTCYNHKRKEKEGGRRRLHVPGGGGGGAGPQGRVRGTPRVLWQQGERQGQGKGNDKEKIKEVTTTVRQWQ